MTTIMIRLLFVFTLIATAMNSGKAIAQNVMNQEWVLNPGLSKVNFQSVKKKTVVETHHFKAMEGSVSKDGDARVTISLDSIETNHDLRNTRMRFLLFETYKFPKAVISAKLEMPILQDLLTKKNIRYPLIFTLSLHGIEKELQAYVSVTRVSDTAVTVATVEPIEVTVESFGLAGGLAKLREAVNGIPIEPSSLVSFELAFATTEIRQKVAQPAMVPLQTAAAPNIASVSAEISAENAYEATAAIGSCGAYMVFEKQYRGTFYGRLAAQHLSSNCQAASAAPQAQPFAPPPTAVTPPTVVASVASGPAPTPVLLAAPAPTPVLLPAPIPVIPPEQLAPALQTALQSIGCYTGGIDGDWGSGSRAALGRFNALAGSNFQPTPPTGEALTAVQAWRGGNCVVIAKTRPARKTVKRKSKTKVSKKKAPATAAKKKPGVGGIGILLGGGGIGIGF